VPFDNSQWTPGLDDVSLSFFVLEPNAIPFLMPGLLHRAIGTALVVLLVVVSSACRYIGPRGPATSRPDTVTILWSGAVTSTSARVVARYEDPEAQVRLAVDTSGEWADPTLLDGTQPATNENVRHFQLTGLTPQTTYHYALEVDGRIASAHRGHFQTVADGPYSFRVALGGCALTGSNHPVFETIRKARPDLFLHLGDMHYENIDATTPEPFRTAYRKVHGAERQSALFRSTALAYVWDDHDYGPNNSSRQAPGQDMAQQVYREYVPHYELARAKQERPIHQAFTVGRVRFLLTDLRSARTPNETPDSLKTMMGTEQKAWFKEQLARAEDRYPVVAWVSSVPWIGDSDSEDRWAGFARERHELATYIDSIGIADQMVILSGDAHMVALDDGTHNHYGQEGGGGFPVVQAAALDQLGSEKGGPYTLGPYPNPFAVFGRTDGQFVLMDVQDDGGEEVCITWTGKRHEVDTGRVVDLLEWSKCFPAS
jgi:phosphodiesterase/alkaline phosphatase D-like protein